MSKLFPKYIIDNENNAISPIMSAETVFLNNGKNVQNIIDIYSKLGDKRDFSENPIDLKSEVTGILPAENVDPILVNRTELHEYAQPIGNYVIEKDIFELQKELYPLFKEIEYDVDNGNLILTRYNDTIIMINLPLREILKTGYLDKTENFTDIVLVLTDDTEIRIPATALIDDFDGEISDTIQVIVSDDNKISANIITGGITKNLLSSELQDFISFTKTKLDGIAENANKYIHPAGSGANKANGLYKITTDSTSHISGAAAVVKADITALGIPAQDTTYSVATQSANGLMSSADKTKLDIVSNENMLINGSYLKPVNQREKTIYTEYGYTIDRWQLLRNNTTLTVKDGYITLDYISDGLNGIWRQMFEPNNIKPLAGKTITASIEYRAPYSGHQLLQIWTAANSYRDVLIPAATDWSIVSNTWTIPADASQFHFTINSLTTASAQSTIDIRRAKLELGSVSTLANDPPVNYGTELTKCQRYQLAASSLHFRATSMSPDIIDFRIPTPVGLRISPTLAAGSLKVYSFPNSAEQTGFTLAALWTAESGQIVVNMKKNGHGLTDAFLRVMDAIFDAEIY